MGSSLTTTVGTAEAVAVGFAVGIAEGVAVGFAVGIAEGVAVLRNKATRISQKGLMNGTYYSRKVRHTKKNPSKKKSRYKQRAWRG